MNICMNLDKLLFPHSEVREVQKDMIEEIDKTLSSHSHLIAHAPTGLGKTASTLPAALAYAIENDLVVFFLTSRHTQHKIAIDTLKAVKQKHNLDFVTIDIIGKKHMCSIPGIETLRTGDFVEYCKSQIENGKCEFYINTKTKGKPTIDASMALNKIELLMPCSTEEVIQECSHYNLCSYEIAMFLSTKAKVIVADYYYIFNDYIRETFFKKAGITLDKSIVIIDEGHNLPERLRELMTIKLTTVILDRAIKEARKYNYEETATNLEIIKRILREFSDKSKDYEILITKEQFIDEIKKTLDYDSLISDFELIAKEIRERQRSTYIGSIANFLIKWPGDDKGFARILQKSNDDVIALTYRCLNPLPIAEPIIKQTYSTILMSGTLTPTNMYKELLGFPENTTERVYPSPFPKQNKLAMVVPETTTKFTARNEDMFKKISDRIAEITDKVPGNSIIFFPSYYFRDKVNNYFLTSSKKTIFSEKQALTKQEKLEMLERFKLYKDSGAVLLGISSGNFNEGIDLPGDLLKCVIIVGLPLQKPNLETKELIKHYDELFGKGWDYGYLFPAFSKCLQGAGRCIRTSEDRGVIVFLDERFAWNQYFRCFPADYNIKIMKNFYTNMIEAFFRKG